jgi:filamentous hemagglutinin
LFRLCSAQIIAIERHPHITQIQIHPGGGRHGGRYYKISTCTQGEIKVVDNATYRPTPGEKATIIPAD